MYTRLLMLRLIEVLGLKILIIFLILYACIQIVLTIHKYFYFFSSITILRDLLIPSMSSVPTATLAVDIFRMHRSRMDDLNRETAI